MAQRTVALCNGEYIGIETIYTVIDGKQINIPDKVQALRKKGRNNELLCPCGCGSHLVLVAGDKNLREQHFRIKDGEHKCQISTETRESIDSKIVLKCWLDDNLHENIETRVPISAVSDSKRKYEFTFLCRESGFAVNYCHDRANLSDEKLSILDENSDGIRILHIVDIENGGSNGQYPEWLMKIQRRQGYCLLLSVQGIDYSLARLRAVYYTQDIQKVWTEVVFSEGLLKDYRIDSQNNIILRNKPLETLYKASMQKYTAELQKERERREEEKRQAAEYLRQIQENEKRRQEEQQKRLAELAEQRRIRDEQIEEQIRQAAEQKLQEKLRREEEFMASLQDRLSQQETLVKDEDGNRWIKCKACGKIAKDSEFLSYGGAGQINLGICKECSSRDPSLLSAHAPHPSSAARKADPSICPKCGGMLKKRNGPYGAFWGCGNYPKCKFTRPV